MAGDIKLSSNFELNSQRALDARTNVASIEERDAIPLIQRYDRMIVSVRGDETYQLRLGLVDNDLANNLNWGYQITGDHVHYKIQNVTNPIVIPGNNYIINIQGAGNSWSLPENQLFVQKFRNEQVSGVYLEAFNRIGFWLSGFATVRITLYRGDQAGELLLQQTFTLSGNGTFYYLDGIVQASELEVFTATLEKIGATSFVQVIKSLDNYTYNAILNGIALEKPSYFTVQSNNIDTVSNPLSKVECKEVGVEVTGTLFVQNIVQNGQSYETHAEQLYTEKDLIILREKAIAALANGVLSGFKIIKYDAINDLIFAVDNNGIARIGDFGSLLQALATREDNPIDGAFAKWNQTALRFDTFDLESYFLKRESIVDSLGITGFIDGDNIDVAYSYANRTITLTGNLIYYFRGEKKQLTSPWTSIAHPNTIGKHYLFSTDGINFTWPNSSWDFKDCMVSVVKRGATNLESFAIRETHKLLDSEAHKLFHVINGTYRSLGGLLTAGSYTENTATDSANSPAFDSAVLEDEDLKSLVNSWPKGLYTTAYIGVGNLMVFDTTKTLPFHSSGSFLHINNPATGAMANGIANRYYNVYQIIAPVCSDSGSQKYRTIILQPQVAYTSLALAQAENVASLRLGDMVNTFTEFVIYARITYATANGDNNAGKCRIATGGVSYITGSKVSQTNVTGLSANDHAQLSNREWELSGHIGTSGSFPDFDGSGVAVLTTKKSAFNLDIETTLSNIKTNGAASLGILSTLARADHIHPIDTSRLGATKAAIEALLTGIISTHSHDFSHSHSDYIDTSLTAQTKAGGLTANDLVVKNNSSPSLWLKNASLVMKAVLQYDSNGSCARLWNSTKDMGLAIYDSDGRAVFSGTCTAQNFILSSDKRLKENIQPIDLDLDIRLVQFNFIGDEKKLKRFGVIAQEVEQVCPDMVYNDDNGMKQVAYIDLLIAKIDSLEKRLAKLEKRLSYD